MNKVMAVVMSVLFSVALIMVVGFVIASIKGYSYNFSSALPFGAALGLILYFFGSIITAEEN